MIRDNDGDKLRAIFLASLMFFWLFAGTVAFAGSSAAQPELVDAPDEIDVAPDGEFELDVTADNAFEVRIEGADREGFTVTGYRATSEGDFGGDGTVPNEDELPVVLEADGDLLTSDVESDEPREQDFFIDMEATVDEGEYTFTVVADDDEETVEQDVTISVDEEEEEEEEEDADVEIEYVAAGTIVYQGQDVFAVGDALPDEADVSLELRRVDAFDAGTVDDSSNVEELVTEEAGDAIGPTGSSALNFYDDEAESDIDENTIVVEIETDDLDADDYFLAGAGDLQGDGDLQRADTFETSIQELDVEFDEEDLPVLTDDVDDSLVELDIDSGRGEYSLNASADGDLDNEELFSILTFGTVLNADDLTVELGDVITEIGDVDISDADGTSGLGIDENTQLNVLIEEIENDGTIIGTGPANDIETDSFFEFLEEVDEEADTDFIGAHTVTVEDDGDAEFEFGDGLAFGDFQVQLLEEDADDDDEIVVIRNIRDTDEDVSAIGIDDDSYDIDFDVVDTEAVATDTLEVEEEDVSVDFAESVTTQTAGDIVFVEADLEDTDEAYIQFGSEDSNFVDIIYVEDDDDSGDVEFYINTRTLGTDAEEDVLHSEDDIVESFIATDGFDGVDLELGEPRFIDGDDVDDDDEFDPTDNVQSFLEYAEELDTIDSDDVDDGNIFGQLVRPLQPSDYDMVATGNNIFYADDSESDVEDEDGFATIDLIRPALGETNTWVGPEESADEEETIAELVEDSPLTQREEVAIDDLMVAQIEASGLYGAMVEIAGEYDAVIPEEEEGFDGDVLEALADEQDSVFGEEEGISFTFEDTDPVGNQDANALDLGESSDDVFILVDNEAGELYVIVDTSDEPFDRDLDDGDTFDIELEYEADDDDRAEFANEGPRVFADGSVNNAGDEAYPYFLAGESAVTSATFDLADRSAEFDNVDAETDLVQIVADDEAVISGETNVAPGSDTTLRVRQRGDTESFLETADVDIEEDGAFEATYGFSERAEGDEARIELRTSGDTIERPDAVFVDAVEGEETPTPTPEETPEETPDEPDTPEDTPDEPDTPEEETPEPDDQAGFGAVIALIALLGAALLAARRNALN